MLPINPITTSSVLPNTGPNKNVNTGGGRQFAAMLNDPQDDALSSVGMAPGLGQSSSQHSLDRFQGGRFGVWQRILEATGFNYQQVAAELQNEQPPQSLVLAAPSDNSMKEWLASTGIAPASELEVMTDQQLFDLVNEVYGQEGIERIVRQNVFQVDQGTYQNFESHVAAGGRFEEDVPAVTNLLANMVRYETGTSPGYRLNGDQIVNDRSIDNTTVRPDGASAEKNIAVIGVKLPLLKEDELHRGNGYGVGQTAIRNKPDYLTGTIPDTVPTAPVEDSSVVNKENVKARPNLGVQDILSEQRFSIWSHIAGNTVTEAMNVVASNPDLKIVVGAMTNDQMKSALVQNGLVSQSEAANMDDADVLDAWQRILGAGDEGEVLSRWLIQRNIFFIDSKNSEQATDYDRVLQRAERDKNIDVIELLNSSSPFNPTRGYVNTSLSDNQVYLKHKEWGRGIVSTDSLVVTGNGMVVTMDAPIRPDRLVWRMEGWREARLDSQRL